MLLKAFAVVVLLVAVNGANLLGGKGKECTYGPSYWCASLENAAKCSAMQHCRERVWSQQPKPAVDSADACTFCKDLVGDVKTYIESNSTKSTIISYMNRACDFMPDQFSMSECKKIEQHYFDEFYQLVEDNLDPDTICNLLRLCANSQAGSGDLKQAAGVLQISKSTLTHVSLSKSKAPVRSAAGLCDDCKLMVNMVKTEIDDKDNQKMMQSMLEQECQQLGGDLAAECKSLVDTFLPEIISTLDQELNEQICFMIGLCSNSTVTVTMDSVVNRAKALLVQQLQASRLSKHITGVASRVSADSCTTCEEVINYVKLFINNNNTEQEVISVLENDVCSQLGEFSSMCKEVVEQYFPDVWSRFIGVLDPKSLCTEIGLCNSTSTIRASQLTAAMPVKKESVGASVQCVVCEFIIDKLKGVLKRNATEQEIEHAVEKVCDILPSSIRKECDSLIEKYGPAIINLLVHDASGATVCGFLGLCASGDARYIMPLSNMMEDNCAMCELAMSYIKSMLSKNSTQQEIEQELEKLCSYLSGKMAQQCNAMVQKYTPELVRLLLQDVAPKQICTEIGLCKAARKVDGLVHLYNRSNV